ncbi:WD repeat domain-containing protein 83 [Condylostylus longicornis]|uniref:WD repeat domain-containing protein 83 n=1 Tax=Condylostylus longicornis TaxID=2530218 RepID=UPI00244E1FA8|nr:WD repeat domain-containing protein 83 [Condylostylus longicornis]
MSFALNEGYLNLICYKTIDCVQGSVRAVRYNVDGIYCLTCGSDRKIKLWNPKTALLLKTYGGHASEVTDAMGSCDSCHIVSASLDKSIIYWDVTTGQPIRRCRVHAGGVNCVRFNEDSSIAVSGSKDNSVMCWDIRTRKIEPIQTMKDAKDCVTSLIVNESQIITASLDGCIRRYDIRMGEIVCDDIGIPITYIVETKDGQCIIAGCLDGRVRLVDNETGNVIQEYVGRKNDDYHIECEKMSNDKHVISGSSEGLIYVWDLLSGKILQHLKANNNTTNSVIHSLTTHPLLNEVIFAKGREIHICGSSEEQSFLE